MVFWYSCALCILAAVYPVVLLFTLWWLLATSFSFAYPPLIQLSLHVDMSPKDFQSKLAGHTCTRFKIEGLYFSFSTYHTNSYVNDADQHTQTSCWHLWTPQDLWPDINQHWTYFQHLGVEIWEIIFSSRMDFISLFQLIHPWFAFPTIENIRRWWFWFSSIRWAPPCPDLFQSLILWSHQMALRHPSCCT